MKVRETFTVVREYSTRRSERDFMGHVAHVQDEAGEFLYGGNSGDEKLTVTVEVKGKNGKWKKLT